MKIIKDSICCKKKIIEKQTGWNGDVPSIDSKPPLTDSKRFFSGLDAMKIICNLDKLDSDNDIRRTGKVKIHGMVISGGKKYLKLEYPILYLKFIGETPSNYNNYDGTEIGMFKVWVTSQGYIFEISKLNADFLEKCEFLLTKENIKKCKNEDVENKIFNKKTFYYINNDKYNIDKLCVELRQFYENIKKENKNAYWDDSTEFCFKFKEMADISRTNENDENDNITNKGFYFKILTDKKFDSTQHGFLVHLDDVNQKCLIGNNLGAAMERFFGKDESKHASRYVITYEQGQQGQRPQYYKIMFRISGDNLYLI